MTDLPRAGPHPSDARGPGVFLAHRGCRL